MLRLLAVAAATLVLGACPAAADICHSQGATQYTDDSRTCVSSVLAPQGRNSYGPENLAGGNDRKVAWCEGVAGAGIGQSITLHQEPAGVIDSLSIVNGYARTPQLFQANGRVKQARIETSSGYQKTIELADSGDIQEIRISPHQLTWVRLVILGVYPGARFTDTCVSTFFFNQE